MNLPTLAPGFCEDRDDPWMVYLGIEKLKFLREKRLEYITLGDDLGTLKMEHLRYLDANKRTFSPEQKRQVVKEYEQKKRALLNEQKALVDELLPHMKALKAEALEIQKRRFQDETDLSRKKRRTEREREVIVETEDVEFVTDDYLPNFMQDDENPSSKVDRDNTAMDFTYLNTSPSKSKSRNKEVDSFLRDVEPRDVEILLELRPLIEKYECRDRVLKALNILRKRDKSLKALEVFTKAKDVLVKK